MSQLPEPTLTAERYMELTKGGHYPVTPLEVAIWKKRRLVEKEGARTAQIGIERGWIPISIWMGKQGPVESVERMRVMRDDLAKKVHEAWYGAKTVVDRRRAKRASHAVRARARRRRQGKAQRREERFGKRGGDGGAGEREAA